MKKEGSKLLLGLPLNSIALGVWVVTILVMFILICIVSLVVASVVGLKVSIHVVHIASSYLEGANS